MDKKEGMNRWKWALLLGGGLAAALLWGCFNPIHAGITDGTDPGSENQGSENPGSADQGSENPGLSPNDGMAGEFIVTLRVGEGPEVPESRSVVGPGAEDIQYDGVCNTVQIIAVDAETQEVKDNQLVNLDNKNDSGKTFWPSIARGKRYHFLVLAGHAERDYEAEKTSGGKYVYKSDSPTLLAAGFLGDQVINGQAIISITMKPLVVDTVFEHGGVTVPAILPDKTTGKGVQLPAKVAASIVWKVTGGFATLVDAQTRTGLPGGLNWGLFLTKQETMFRFGGDPIKDFAVLGGADRNQIVLDLGEREKDVSGSANFNLTYNPLGMKETWIIRNGVNDEAQNVNTTFTLVSGKIPWDGTKNGNGAVAFTFAEREISHIDLTDLVPAPVTGEVPVKDTFTGGTYTGKVSWDPEPESFFKGETVYAATVSELKGEGGFQLSGDFTVAHSGKFSIVHVPGAKKANVLFPKTGAVLEYGGSFSGSSAKPADKKMDSVIDIISLAQAEGFSPLSLKLHPWPEKVDFTAGTDFGTTGLVLTATGAGANSPAVVTIDGGDKTISLASGKGSVITVGAGVTLTLRNITFKGIIDNDSPLITVDGGTLVLEDGAVITGNTNTADNAGAGVNALPNTGGVSVAGAGKLVMRGGSISGNTTTAAGAYANPNTGGGGVSVAAGGAFTMSGGSVSGNKTAATNGGGGVYMAGGDAASTFTMSGGTISGNETTNANTSGGTYSGTEAVHGAGGGGVSVYGGTFIMSGTASISANTTAYPLGEGVYVRGDGTLFVMNGGEISGHNRTGVGIDHGGAFTMNGGKIHHNTNPTVNGESLINSQSNRSGGGVRVGYNADDGVSNRATFVMKGGEITDNTAPSGTDLGGYANEGGGGGVFVGRGEDSSLPPQFTMEGGTISNNRGGGVRVLVSSTFTMKDGTISGNTNGAFGGGVLAFGTFTMTGGTISGNHADKGGGVYPHHGYTMKGGTISGNTATAEGGGVWLGFSSAERVIAGGTISGNTAPRGGGVFVMQSGIGMNFKKTGGIIYGKDAVNANVATSGDKSGHALFYQQGTAPGAGDKYYDITADEGDELGVTGTTPSGDWLPSP